MMKLILLNKSLIPHSLYIHCCIWWCMNFQMQSMFLDNSLEKEHRSLVEHYMDLDCMPMLMKLILLNIPLMSHSVYIHCYIEWYMIFQMQSMFLENNSEMVHLQLVEHCMNLNLNLDCTSMMKLILLNKSLMSYSVYIHCYIEWCMNFLIQLKILPDNLETAHF